MTLGEAVQKNQKLERCNSSVEYPHATATRALAEAQHAPGVICRYNPQRFVVEYIRPDGTLIPNYEHYLSLAKQGKI